MPPSRFQIVVPTLPVADIELPGEVARLHELAYNLWWSWSSSARHLFQSIDPAAWDLYHNPVQLLINIEPSHWRPLLENRDFMQRYRQVLESFDAYMHRAEPTWFERRYRGFRGGPVAYFSMEYGIHSSLAIYSGGLGVLSGDHAKSASDLGLPFVAVGLAYRRGYFRQTVDGEGRQQHNYPEYDFARLPLRPAADRDGNELEVRVQMPGREVLARVWVAQIGRVPLLLLDTHVVANHPADRPITGTLYVSGREMRLTQELLLGVGGVKALEALGIEPTVWHINEGHCALLQLERLARAVESGNKATPRSIGKQVVFTTHTPVPAGNEAFDRDLTARYLEPWAERTGLELDDLLALGEAGQQPGDRSFNLTAFALKTSRATNAVSKLNAEVTSRMWGHLLEPKKDEPAIFPITNGVHAASWVGRDLRALFTSCLGDWQEKLLLPEAWQRFTDVDPAELWNAHLEQKRRLADLVRERVRDQQARHGHSPDELRRVDTLLDPMALTIGFARRFATYKRAKLVFSDLERLQALIANDERPMQLLFAGKAHPADAAGQALIQQIFALSRRADLKGRVVFIEDYDMRIGRRLVQGVDVWLNTPRKPMEASGTSGQKAAMNGALNLSILDGWWPEGFDGDNGWAIDGEEEGEIESTEALEAAQDAADAAALYELLEDEVVPTFYDRDERGLPMAWIERMADAIATITPNFSSSRMVRDYVERCYFPRPSS